VAASTFGHVSSNADAILVGKVVRVVSIPCRLGKHDFEYSVPIACVDVREWWKGDPQPKRVWFLARSLTWGNGSRAVVGEQALFLLDRIEDVSDWAEDFSDPRLAGRITAATGPGRFHLLAWAGHGRAPLVNLGGTEYAEFAGSRIRGPRDLPSIPGPDPRYPGYGRLPRLDALRRLVVDRRTYEPGADGEVFRLVKALDADDESGDAAADELRDLGAKAVPALFRLLEEPANPWRERAAVALRLLGGLGESALLDGLASPDPARRRSAAYALQVFCGLAGRDHTSLFSVVQGALTHTDAVVRRHAVEALGTWYGAAAFSAVVRALEDESLPVRRSAMRTLVELGEKIRSARDPSLERAEQALLGLTKHEKTAIRREAWEALALTAGPKSLSASLRAIVSADRVIQWTAAVALGRTADGKALKPLVESLGSEDTRLRRSAAYGLGLGRFAGAVDALVKALEDPDYAVVWISIGSLGSIGPAAKAAVPALERILEKEKGSPEMLPVVMALRAIRKPDEPR